MNDWHKIGYHNIRKDVNDWSCKSVIIMLFSPASAANWTPPNPEEVVTQLSELIMLRFELHYTVIVNIFLLGKRLVEAGNTMIKVFFQVKK